MRSEESRRPARYGSVFAWPIALGLLGVIGLASALIGDNLWDALSWATLTAPILIIAWHIARAKRR
jgi:hypothetical protein